MGTMTTRVRIRYVAKIVPICFFMMLPSLLKGPTRHRLESILTAVFHPISPNAGFATDIYINPGLMFLKTNPKFSSTHKNIYEKMREINMSK